MHGWSPVNICVVYVFGAFARFQSDCFTCSIAQPCAVGPRITWKQGCAGDLYFSAIKRRLGIKDYSRVLSSHGCLVDTTLVILCLELGKVPVGLRLTSVYCH